ncbi:MAG TPA: hypothetical protein VN649_20265 [Ramlibacter sp.]|nr:hypothetical protein [Ramlibacter sp.]
MLDPRPHADVPLPTADEQLSSGNIPEPCTHLTWKRSIEQFAQYAICHTCGERLFLSGNWAPELSYDAVCALWLK